MQTPYELPNGDTAMVTDIETAGRSLGGAVELWREGATEPLIYGSAGKPEGVVISFEQWSEYETLKEDADDDRRRYEGVRRRLANSTRPSWCPSRTRPAKVAGISTYRPGRPMPPIVGDNDLPPAVRRRTPSGSRPAERRVAVHSRQRGRPGVRRGDQCHESAAVRQRGLLRKVSVLRPARVPTTCGTAPN